MSRPPINDINTTPGRVALGPLPNKSPVMAFNPDEIFNLLETKGFVAYHYIHCLNPDRETIDSPVNPTTQAAFRGRIYYEVREVKIVPQQFRIEDKLNIQGIWRKGSVLFNISGHYNDGDKGVVDVSHGDIILLNPTFTEKARQLIEFNPNGPQILNFKAKGIDLLMDKRGNKFLEGEDFTLMDGKIYWLDSGRKPQFINGKGDVLSVVYWMTPIYLVETLLHSTRIIPGNNIGHGAVPREATYMPQQMVVTPLTAMEEKDILDWMALPPLPEYPASHNTTGGSF